MRPFFGAVPENLDDVLAELAHAYKWQPSELFAMEVDDLLVFHRQIGRINKLLSEGK